MGFAHSSRDVSGTFANSSQLRGTVFRVGIVIRVPAPDCGVDVIGYGFLVLWFCFFSEAGAVDGRNALAFYYRGGGATLATGGNASGALDFRLVLDEAVWNGGDAVVRTVLFFSRFWDGGLTQREENRNRFAVTDV